MCKKSERYYDWAKDLREFVEKCGLNMVIRSMPGSPAEVTFCNELLEATYIVDPLRFGTVRNHIVGIKWAILNLLEQNPISKKVSVVTYATYSLPKIRNVYFNNPVTVVIWADGTKTIVRCENEEYDPEKGLAMAISKKALGNKGRYFDTFKYWLKRNEEDNNEND